MVLGTLIALLRRLELFTDKKPNGNASLRREKKDLTENLVSHVAFELLKIIVFLKILTSVHPFNFYKTFTSILRVIEFSA